MADNPLRPHGRFARHRRTDPRILLDATDGDREPSTAEIVHDLLHPDRAVGDEFGRTGDAADESPPEPSPREQPATAVDPFAHDKRASDGAHGH